MTDPRAAARAVDSLRRGWPVTIGDGSQALSAYAVETGDACLWKKFSRFIFQLLRAESTETHDFTSAVYA